MILEARGHSFDLTHRPLIVGVMGMLLQGPVRDLREFVSQALRRARALREEGADMVEVGILSDPQGWLMATETEEEFLRTFVGMWDPSVPLVIRTDRADVAEAVLPLGGHVFAGGASLGGVGIARMCARTGAALIIENNIEEGDLAERNGVLPALLERAAKGCEQAGMSLKSVWLSAGAGIKGVSQLKDIRPLGRPLVVSCVAPVSGAAALSEACVAACVVQGMLKGGAVFRVPFVRPALSAARIIGALGVFG